MTNNQWLMANVKINRALFLLAFLIILARGFLFTGAMPVVHYVLLAGKIALIPIAIILALRTSGRPTAIDLCMLLYYVVMCVCCLLNSTPILSVTLMALDVFIFWAMCRWFFARSSLFPLKVTTCFLLAFIAVNFLLMLWRPEGLWHYATNGKMYYLLGGNYNNMGKALLIAMVSNILLLRFIPRPTAPASSIFEPYIFYRLTFALTIILSYGTLLIVGSKTSLLGITLLLAFSVLLLFRSKWLRITCLSLFIVLYFGFQSWTVFHNLDTSLPKTEYFIQHVLHKDLTFTLRTNIWTRSKQLIERRPAIGYGEHDDMWYQLELEGLTTHNLVLHILLKGGWLTLCAFILLLIVLHLLLLIRGPNTTPIAADLTFFILAALWVYLFMMIVEVYPFFSLAILFIYAGYTIPPAFQPVDRTSDSENKGCC